VRYFRKAVASIVILIVVLLPCKLRVLFIESIAWVFQGLYLIYFKLMVIILKNVSSGLKKDKGEKIK